MLCKIFRYTNPVRVLNLLFTSAVICLAPLFVFSCQERTRETTVPIGTKVTEERSSAQAPAEHAWSIELREEEYKTVRHPEKRFYADIWSTGLQVHFKTALGHFGTYEFAHEKFPVGVPAFLSCPGSPDLLPLRVVRLNEGEVNYCYKIEWLAKSPATSDGASIVVRYR